MTRFTSAPGLLLALIASLLTAACSAGLPAAPTATGGVDLLRGPAAVTGAAASALASDKACWGQATKVFAQTGEMGRHASEQQTPRLGLRNLARALYEEGVLPEPTLQALGAFVAEALGLSIEACMRE